MTGAPNSLEGRTMYNSFPTGGAIKVANFELKKTI